MTRLTKKHGDGYGSWTQFSDEYIPSHNVRHKECVVKLGRLEDIEEELGCPLEVIFKALKDGIIINEEGYVNDAEDEHKFNEEEDSYYNGVQLYFNGEEYFFNETYSPYGDSCCGEIGCYVNVKDYQKTWWLQGDKND